MKDKEQNIQDDCEKYPYTKPRILMKHELVVELQTNVLPDEPPPPMGP